MGVAVDAVSLGEIERALRAGYVRTRPRMTSCSRPTSSTRRRWHASSHWEFRQLRTPDMLRQLGRVGEAIRFGSGSIQVSDMVTTARPTQVVLEQAWNLA